jgi:hypothetical protein
MFTKDESYFLDREIIYAMLTAEDRYASGWGEAKASSVPVFPDHSVNADTGMPFSMMEWLVFAEKYIDEAKVAYGNYVPDLRAIRIRLLKAASLLVTALQVHGENSDLNDIAGVSSTNYPIIHGGLQAYKDMAK